MYFELNADALSLTKLAFAPYTATEMLSDGTASRNTTLALDGKGAATYTTVEGEGDAAEKVTLVGTADTTGAKTVFGDDIYRFRSGNTSFEFVRVVVSNSVYFARLNDSVNGVYTFGDSKISLDGFGYRALYTDESGNEIEGYYYLGDNGALTFISESGYIYLDLKEDKTFTKRGFEYGSYVVLNNRTNGGMTVAFDGYGKLTLSVTSLNEETGKYETKDIATDVEYTLADGYCSFTYTMSNGTSVTLKCQFGYFRSGTSTYNAFFVRNEEVVMNFIDTNDWSVLSLDGYGNAVKVGKTGEKETGTYMLITDDLLYYATDSDASIYKYNLTNGTITPVENRARGYYTKDLESLVFTKYGFAVFNGTTVITTTLWTAFATFIIRNSTKTVLFRRKPTSTATSKKCSANSPKPKSTQERLTITTTAPLSTSSVPKKTRVSSEFRYREKKKPNIAPSDISPSRLPEQISLR